MESSSKIPIWGWVLLFILLVATGLGTWSYLDEEDEGTSDEKGRGSGYGGGATGSGGADSTNSSGGSQLNNPGYTAPQWLIDKMLNENLDRRGPTDSGRSSDNPIYYLDPAAQRKIKATAEKLALDADFLASVRNQRRIGVELMRQGDQQQAIDFLMFTKLGLAGDIPDITSHPKRWLLFPITTTYEPKGGAIRSELQNLASTDWEKLNLTLLRDKNAAWWSDELKINFLVGTTVFQTPSSSTIWGGHAQGEELWFYRYMNGFQGSSHMDLAGAYVDRARPYGGNVQASHPNARASLCAVAMWYWVKDWVAAIDRYDQAMTYAAMIFLENLPEADRWYFTFTNPDTGQDESNDPNNPLFDFLTQDGRNGGGSGGSDKLTL